MLTSMSSTPYDAEHEAHLRRIIREELEAEREQADARSKARADWFWWAASLVVFGPFALAAAAVYFVANLALHLATRIEGSSRDVEDIVHDAFLRAFERINDLTDRGAFKSWLGAIVVHAVRSRMRRHRLMNVLGLGRKSEPVTIARFSMIMRSGADQIGVAPDARCRMRPSIARAARLRSA